MFSIAFQIFAMTPTKNFHPCNLRITTICNISTMSPLVLISSLLLLLLPGVTASADSSGTAIEGGADNSNLNQKIKRRNEFVILEGHKNRENYHSPLPYTYIRQEDLPVCVFGPV